MNKRLQKLNDFKQQRAAKVKAQKVLLDQVDADESRSEFTTEEQTQFDDLDEEIRGLDPQIENLQKQVDAEQRAASMAGAGVGNGEQREKEGIEARFSFKRAINASKDHKSLDGAELEVRQIAEEEARNAGIQLTGNAAFIIPASMMRASNETSPYQTVTEDAGEYGGSLVPTSVHPVIAPLLPKLTLEALGLNVLSGLVGNLALPSGGEYSFNFLEETDAAPEQKSKFGKKILKPKRMAANVGISNQLLIQSDGIAERFIREMIGKAAAQKLVATVLNGAGTMSDPTDMNQLEPLGILNLTGVQVGAATGLPSLASIVELETLLEEANVDTESLAYVMNPKLKGLLKTLKIDEGSGKMILTDNNEVNGYRYLSTTLLPRLSDGAGGWTYPMIFGDFSQAYVGLWGGAEFVFDPYTKAAENTTRLVCNMHTDVQVANEKAFAVNKALTLTAPPVGGGGEG